ncbi:MAG: hypothetical protein ACYTEE_01185 [Planctomycetota bacterium]|jgi:hypothetical protein
MIEKASLANISLMTRWRSVYQTIVAENNPLKSEKKGALEKFINHVRDQAQAAQNTICYNRFFLIIKRTLDESNQIQATKVLKKAEVLTRYNSYLEHVQNQLDILG